MSARGPANTHRQQIIDIVRQRGLLRLPEPVVLASGELSRDFIDGKAALSRGDDLKLACEAILDNRENRSPSTGVVQAGALACIAGVAARQPGSGR